MKTKFAEIFGSWGGGLPIGSVGQSLHWFRFRYLIDLTHLYLTVAGDLFLSELDVLLRDVCLYTLSHNAMSWTVCCNTLLNFVMEQRSPATLLREAFAHS
jgi:hypothetical protein